MYRGVGNDHEIIYFKKNEYSSSFRFVGVLIVGIRIPVFNNQSYKRDHQVIKSSLSQYLHLPIRPSRILHFHLSHSHVLLCCDDRSSSSIVKRPGLCYANRINPSFILILHHPCNLKRVTQRQKNLLENVAGANALKRALRVSEERSKHLLRVN
jgi:hypothetical protein